MKKVLPAKILIPVRVLLLCAFLASKTLANAGEC
jgi:hypothetical protein